jgi:DNA polymerase-3 subunit beta
VKIECKRDELRTALERVVRVAAARSPVRVLACVSLATEQDGLVLSATDMELSIRTSISCRVEAAGAVAPPIRRLLDLVRLLPGDTVSLGGDAEIRVSSEGADYVLRGADPRDFPSLPVVTGGQVVELDCAALVAASARVLRAASSDLSRPVYTGVQLRIDGDRLTLVATDGYRLAARTTSLTGPAATVDVVVPARALAEFARIASDGGTVRISIGENLIEFGLPTATLWARRIEGRPQDHEPILESSFAHDARVSRSDLLAAVSRAALMADRNAPIELDFARSELAVRVRDDAGEAHERLTLAAPVDTMRIGFNARFLRDGLELIEGEEVVFRMNDGIRPVVLRGSDDEFSYLVAPLRVAPA